MFELYIEPGLEVFLDHPYLGLLLFYSFIFPLRYYLYSVRIKISISYTLMLGECFIFCFYCIFILYMQTCKLPYEVPSELKH